MYSLVFSAIVSCGVDACDYAGRHFGLAGPLR